MAISKRIKEVDIILYTPFNNSRSAAIRLNEILKEEKYAVVKSTYYMSPTLMRVSEFPLDPVTFPTDFLVNKATANSFLTFLQKASNII